MTIKLSKADSENLTSGQKAQIIQYKKDWAAANAAGDAEGMRKANENAEAVRAQAGYSGGADGGGYTPLSSFGASANEVKRWVDDYVYLNYNSDRGWINGYSAEMNKRSMANYIRQQMQANSDAWNSADEAGKSYLHDQNQQLAQVLSDAVGGVKSVYNADLGRWETDNANLGYGYNTGSYRDESWAKERYGMTDEQIESYRNDKARYRNFVDQGIIRNWFDESNGYTGQYAQFVNGPYGILLKGTMGVNSDTYRDNIGDGFAEENQWAPTRDREGNIVPRLPELKNNNNLTDYTRQFVSTVNENGVIEPGLLVTTNPGGRNPGIQTAYVPPLVEQGSFDAVGTLEQWQQSAMAQAAASYDRTVDQAVQALLQAQAEANSRYQTQRDQIAKDELNALDNSALYAETRGDRGGIGRSQYDQIQAQAGANRQAVADAQVRLAADTAQQIAQLRADGEFEKADEMMQISQTFLLKLLDMEQWAAEYQLSVEKFQESIRQWEKEYQLSLAKALI